MPHPKNKAERRRINRKKYVSKTEREEAIQLRIAEEEREAKEVLRELRGIDREPESND